MPDGSGNPAHEKCRAWKNVNCPKCGADAERVKTGTIDTFIDFTTSPSSILLLRPALRQQRQVNSADTQIPIDQPSAAASGTHIFYLFLLPFLGKSDRDFQYS